MPFHAIVGHRRQTALLARAIERGALPPTLLFAGPMGVGKWRVALATAQALNCLEPRRSPDRPLAVDACGTCRACERIARGIHVDVIAVEPDEKASIKIDVVRDVLSRTSYRPFEGRRRVVIVRDADTLEPQAQNALLKSLEEPPPATVFIMTTAVPGALLPTVRSRSMTLRFGRLTADEVSAVLVRDHEQTEPEARAVAAMADGSVGQALSFGSTDVAVLRETALLLLTQTAGRADVQGRLQAAGAVASSPSKKDRPREELAVVLRLAASMLRDIEAINAGADPRVLANPVAAAELRAIACDFGGDRAREAFVAVDRALVALGRNAGPKVVTEWLSMQI
ncbi:MAG: DNA polymerase III subunit [Acidobacteria bacterium]|nr:DNA polymerase III subunit [Acidobacteriota bacterium]